MRALAGTICLLGLAACTPSPQQAACENLDCLIDRAHEYCAQNECEVAGGHALLQASSPPSPAQREIFGPLADFVGQRFKGVPTGESTEINPDYQSWHWALGGSAILIKHAIDDGAYGGDTYVYKDARAGGLVYVYVTNAGFRTEGTMTLHDDGSYTAEEAVLGHDTITMVRSTSRKNADGTLTTTSELLENGEWRAGHSFTYSATTEHIPALTPPSAE